MIPVSELEPGDLVRALPNGPVLVVDWRTTRRVTGVHIVAFTGNPGMPVVYAKGAMLYDEEGK